MKKCPTFGFSLLTSTPRPVAAPLKTPLRTSTIKAKPYPLCPECSSPSPPMGQNSAAQSLGQSIEDGMRVFSSLSVLVHGPSQRHFLPLAIVDLKLPARN